jgi:hypothetical protein
MKRYMRGALVTLATPAAAGAIFVAPAAFTTPTATAAVTAPAFGLSCRASMSNSKPKDRTTTYVNVSTAKNADVTAVAHFKTTNRTHSAKADAKGTAKIGYAVASATPGKPVKVDVTVTSGKSSKTCSTSFTPQK